MRGGRLAENRSPIMVMVRRITLRTAGVATFGSGSYPAWTSWWLLRAGIVIGNASISWEITRQLGPAPAVQRDDRPLRKNLGDPTKHAGPAPMGGPGATSRSRRAARISRSRCFHELTLITYTCQM